MTWTYQFYNHDELGKLAVYFENPTIMHIFATRKSIGSQQADKAFFWEFLKRHSENNQHFKELLNLAVVKLRALTGTVQMLPKLAEQSLLGLVFMLSQWVGY
ncbi:hypothetical protein RFI_14119, partial [Reticulomyxa filosa]